ncbi:sugar/nucleoside kinase (ribokinase family) [Salana multivorans]|uniref:Sugar/nucleoside kinase (Ribokinase family) n=1 Tax=Salana multivorans TaxID=120377 RepID=A0A3N2D9C5_9MICO|nr:PfkB family carbohydrate kinase [Salana multivorans]ROR96381.1 sugar/nucleoside kinase (ribokinase family) [Salana multivorans]
MSPTVYSTVSAIVDLPLAMPHLPERGGDVLGTAADPTPGGGVNTALAAARQGAVTVLASPLGTGAWGRLARAALEAEGVACPVTADGGAGDTGLCVTVVEPDGERTFLTAAGVEADLRPEWLAPIAAGPADVVVVSGYDLAYDSGAVLADWLESDAVRGRIVLDVSPVCDVVAPDLLDRVLARAAVVSLNERETGLLGGASAVRSRLGSLGNPGAAVLHRLGAAGTRVETNDGGLAEVSVPSLHLEPDRVVDTTGAGDAHTGVLAACLAAGWELSAAVRRANLAGAITVTRRGPATCPTAAELDALGV